MTDRDYPKHIAYSVGVLKPSTHNMMVANLKAVAERAGIPEEAVYMSLSGTLSKHEQALMKNQHHLFKEYKGLIYLGEFEDSILDHLSAITGMYIRNFYTAKLRMMSEVITALKAGDHDYLQCKCLSIPDFFTIGSGIGKKMYDSDISMLLSFLYRRANSKDLTFIHVESMEKLQQSLGGTLAKCVNAYKRITPQEIKNI